MARYGWNGIKSDPVVTLAAATTSTAFSIPLGARSMTIHAPAMDGAATTYKIQSLNPNSPELGTEVWADLYVWNPAAPGFVALAAFPEAQTTVLQASVFGGGVIRYVLSAANTTADLRIPTIFNF